MTSNENKSIDIDSLESLYEYSNAVFKSNMNYMVGKIYNLSDNNARLEHHVELLAHTKAAVKRVMEEAATKKMLYFENVTVNNLCASVEACLLEGLQKRNVGLFEDSPSLALLKKISKDCEAAADILQRIKTNSENNSGQSNGVRFFGETETGNNSQQSNHNSSMKSPGTINLPSPFTAWFNRQKPPQIKYLWIKMALVYKKINVIVEFIIARQSLYYDSNSLMANSLSSRLFLDLIVGPSSLDYSLVRPSDHLWSEPDATELIDRHRIHSNTTAASTGSWQQAIFSRRARRLGNDAVNSSGINSGSFPPSNGANSTPVMGVNRGDSYHGTKTSLRSNKRSLYSSGSGGGQQPSLRLKDSMAQANPIQSCVVLLSNNNNSNLHNNASNNNISSTHLSNYSSSSVNYGNSNDFPIATANSNSNISTSGAVVAKEYVESLHQNGKNELLYGKNNVLVQPKEEFGNMRGYLSLHQTNDKLYLKWTPNQLINHQATSTTSSLPSQHNNFSTDTDGVAGDTIDENYYGDSAFVNTEYDTSTNQIVQWDSSLCINMDNIVYLHCHQIENKVGKITMVCQDGVQQPPFYFPPGGHLLQFLICLENGLAPLRLLEPPLQIINDEKSFPKLIIRHKTNSVSSTNSAPVVNYVAGRATIGHTASSPTSNNGSSNSINKSISGETSASFGSTLLSHFNRSFSRQKKNDKESSTDKNTTKSVENSQECDFVFRIIYKTPLSAGLDNSNNSAILKSQFHWESNDSGATNDSGNSIDILCSVMKRQILSRAFYGWLQYFRKIKIVRTKFSSLVLEGSASIDVPSDASEGLTKEIWEQFKVDQNITVDEIYRLIYFGGCSEQIRNEIWPRLLEHYPWKIEADSENDSKDIASVIKQINIDTELKYEKYLGQWRALEVIITQRQNEQSAAITSLVKVSNNQSSSSAPLANHSLVRQMEVVISPDRSNDNLTISADESVSSFDSTVVPAIGDSSYDNTKRTSISVSNCDLKPSKDFYSSDSTTPDNNNRGVSGADTADDDDYTFSDEEINCMADNLHRIDKDVDRCDRNYNFFSSHGANRQKGKSNLKKLRNIMVTWVWKNISVGYVQGMCDLLAPLLVILDSESLTFACFTGLMKRMINNFPQMGNQMDDTLEMMALLLQIIDNRLYEHMCPDGEVTSLYVTYRWFLLDFKREMRYIDIFCVWETIWSSYKVASKHFNLFLALSMLQYYRDIILDNKMEYTDIIKFFNEMAEKHQVERLLFIARDLIESIRELLESK